MPVENNFQHDELSRKNPGERLAVTELTVGAPPDSPEWLEAMAGHGRALSHAGVRTQALAEHPSDHAEGADPQRDLEAATR